MVCRELWKAMDVVGVRRGEGRREGGQRERALAFLAEALFQRNCRFIVPSRPHGTVSKLRHTIESRRIPKLSSTSLSNPSSHDIRIYVYVYMSVYREG